MEVDVSTFGFKSAFFIVASIYGGHSSTEVNNKILSYPYITQVMMDAHCEILWDDNSGAYLGRYPTENYAELLDDS